MTKLFFFDKNANKIVRIPFKINRITTDNIDEVFIFNKCKNEIFYIVQIFVKKKKHLLFPKKIYPRI